MDNVEHRARTRAAYDRLAPVWSAMIEETRRRCGDRGHFAAADLAEPLGLAPSSFDGVASSLALHYLEDWSAPLQSFASALRPGGWLVFSTEHPASPALTAQHQSYFATELVSETWSKGDAEVTQHFWRRPLGAILDVCRTAGFMLDRIAETRPTPEALAAFPDELRLFADTPSFIVYRFLLGR